MSRALNDLHPHFRRIAVEVLAQLLEEGIAVAIIGTGRTQAEQDAAVARGASKVRHSKHQDGLAIDLCPYEVYRLDGEDKLNWNAGNRGFDAIGRIGERNGLRWGGRFGESQPGRGDGWDRGHLELPVPA
jgi:hypothetical protein